MKVTPEQVNIFINNIRETGEYGTALQAVFDTFPTEPTPEQINRASKAFAGINYYPAIDTLREVLKAALTEPPPKVYPYAEPAPHDDYVMIYINDRSPAYRVFVPDCMEFDYEKLEMRLKK